MPEAEVESELKPEQQGGSSISSSVPSALILHSLLHELPTNPRPLVGQPLPALVPHLKMADSHQKETGPIQYNTFLNTSYKKPRKINICTPFFHSLLLFIMRYFAGSGDLDVKRF
jgi:hypothetical protein